MKKYLLLMGLFTSTTPVWAAGQAVLQSNINGKIEQAQLAWLSDQQLRMDISRPPAEILLEHGALYAITQIGGMPIVANVADVDQMARALGHGGVFSGQIDKQLAKSISAFEATGRNETVAGIVGAVYQITWQDNQGKSHTDEAVLTKNATVVELSRALQNLSTAAHKGWDARSAEIIHKGFGVLRYGKEYQLRSVSAQAPSASALALPAQSIDVQKLIRGFAGAQ
ncbi:MAG: hypothetical protein JXK51_01075 [Halothiobacillaceae bacterium]|nr:hypothetical protein [Halothiobacillaceae bacterium]